MRELYFKNILIADTQVKKAHFHTFEKGFNVITSHDNHVGKSSLLKSLFYAMGAEVDFDNVWDKNTKLIIVEFVIEQQEYKIARWNKAFALLKNDNLILTTKSVSKDLAKKLEEIFSFSVYLANKGTRKIELAPPAFTYMPYYVDQDKGWSGLYESFSNIDQYRKDDRIKSLYYHLGIYTRFTVELMAEQDELKDELARLKSEEERINITLDSLNDEIQNIVPAENLEELEANLRIPKKKISVLVKRIGNYRNRIQDLESSLAQHEHQLEVIKEYHRIQGKKSVTDKKNETVYNCPKCGYSFDEEIYQIVRSNYNIRNEDYLQQQIEQIILSINDELGRIKKKYVSLMSELDALEKAYDESQDAYEVYVRQRGLQESVKHFTNLLGDNTYEQNIHEKRIKNIGKELKKLPNKQEIEEDYIANVRSNIIRLDAWDASYDGKIKLLKPIKAQGTLENKIILAQMVALFQTMQHFQTNAITLPFIIDSPRAKEASQSSSEDILKLIFDLEDLPQIILATMDFRDFEKELKRRVTVSTLSEKRNLLDDDTYKEFQREIEDMFELLSVL